MCDGQADLGRDQRRRNRRIDVAVHDDKRRLQVGERALYGDHDRGRLTRLAAGPDAQVQVWLGQPQIGEEDVRHAGVVVLARMDQPLPDPAALQGADDRGRLHEVGPCPDDVRDAAGHRLLFAGGTQPSNYP